MPKPKYEFMGTGPELRDFEFDAFSRVVKRVENGDILFEKKGETSNAAVYDRAGKKGAIAGRE
jgi:hypothetical protein